MLSVRNPMPVTGFAAPMLNGATVHIPWPDAEVNEVSLDSLAPLARPSSAAPQRDIAVCDWNEESLSTVKSRLRLSVAERLAAAPGEQVAELASRVQASVLECMAALDELHATLKHEHRRRRSSRPRFRVRKRRSCRHAPNWSALRPVSGVRVTLPCTTA